MDLIKKEQIKTKLTVQIFDQIKKVSILEGIKRDIKGIFRRQCKLF